MGFLSSVLKAAGPIASLIPGIGPAVSAGIGAFANAGSSALDQRADAQETQRLEARSDARYQQTFAESKAGAELSNAQRIAQANTQMDFQERMSSSSHQREVDDLKAAGLNPILSSKYGGSSTPGGAMAQIADAVTPAQSSAQGARAREAELQSAAASINAQKAATENTRAATSQTHAGTAKLRAETENTKEQRHVIRQTENNLRQTERLIRNQTHQSQTTSAKSEAETQMSGLDYKLKGMTIQEAKNAEAQSKAIFHMTGGGTVQGANTAMKVLALGKALLK